MSGFYCEADVMSEGKCATQCSECMAEADESDLPCGCDHVDTSCDVPDCPLNNRIDSGKASP